MKNQRKVMSAVSSRANADCWKNSEVKVLIEFILFHLSEKWPLHHKNKLWEAAAGYVNIRGQTELLRSGNQETHHILHGHCESVICICKVKTEN